MSDQDRANGFIKEYEEISKKYGMQLTAQLINRTLGVQMQIEPQLTLQPIENWEEVMQPPADPIPFPTYQP